MKPLWRCLHDEHFNHRTTLSNFSHDFDLSKMENYMDKDSVCTTLNKYPLHMDLQLSKCTQGFPLTHKELSTVIKSKELRARVTRGALNVLFAKFSYDFTDCCWGCKTSSLWSVNWAWFLLPALVSLQILKLQEANDHHLVFPANWRACICLGVKVKSSLWLWIMHLVFQLWRLLLWGSSWNAEKHMK